MNRHNTAAEKSKRNKIISLLFWLGAGLIIALGILFQPDIILPGVLIFSGLALIFEQVSRKALSNEKIAMDDKISEGFLSYTSKKTVRTPKKVLNEEINQKAGLLEEGKIFAAEIDKANSLIDERQITDDLNEISACVTDIFNAASKEASIEKQIRKFSAHYLPMMLKLLNLYIDLNKRKMQTKAIKQLKSDIADMIGKVRIAFCKLNEELFQQTSFNAEAEIEALNTILSVDGLIGGLELTLPEKERISEKNTDEI